MSMPQQAHVQNLSYIAPDQIPFPGKANRQLAMLKKQAADMIRIAVQEEQEKQPDDPLHKVYENLAEMNQYLQSISSAFTAASTWPDDKSRTKQLIKEVVGELQKAMDTLQAAIEWEAPRTADEPLSSRELEVAVLVASGLSNMEIADRLIISPRTVSTHLERIYRKLNIHSRSALTKYILEQ